MRRDGGTRSSVTVEPDFLGYLAAMGTGDQERCLKLVRWFEQRLDVHERKDRSEAVEGSARRKLRCVRASNHLRVIYASSDNVRTWVWAGRYIDMAGMALRLDAAESPKRHEIVEVETMLRLLHQNHAGGNGTVKKIQPLSIQPLSLMTGSPTAPKPTDAAVTSIAEAVDDATLLVAESKTVCGSITSKLSALVEALQAFRSENKALKEERDRAKRELERKPTTPPFPPSPPPAAGAATVVQSAQLVKLSDYNELRAERDRLTDRLKSAERRAALKDFTGNQVEQVKKMAAEEIRIVKREGEKLRTELAAARTALNKTESGVLSEKAKDDLKDRCAKVCDDQASVIGRSERESLQEQAEELRRLAMKIRAIK